MLQAEVHSNSRADHQHLGNNSEFCEFQQFSSQVALLNCFLQHVTFVTTTYQLTAQMGQTATRNLCKSSSYLTDSNRTFIPLCPERLQITAPFSYFSLRRRE